MTLSVTRGWLANQSPLPPFPDRMWQSPLSTHFLLLSKTIAGWWGRSFLSRKQQNSFPVQEYSENVFFVTSSPSYKEWKSVSLVCHTQEHLYSLLGGWELNRQFRSYLAWWWFINRPWPAVYNSSVPSNICNVLTWHWFHSSDTRVLKSASDVGMSPASSVSSWGSHLAIQLCLPIPEAPVYFPTNSSLGILQCT